MATRHKGKNIKVFLSSTFRDMDAERDIIMNDVYPAVARQLAPHGIHIDFIDLRWGVSTRSVSEAERENHVLRECIDSIQSARPFFVGLLGNRYGWVPSQDSWDTIVGGMTDNEKQFINSDTAQARSVTELEILFGALMDTDNLHRSFFCMRSPDAYGDMDPTHRATFCEQGDEAARRLQTLKDKIADTMHAHGLDRNICHYPCQWDGQRLTGLDTLACWLTTALVQEILLYESEDDAPAPDNEYERTEQQTAARVAQSNRLFCGREQWLQWLDHYAATHDRGVLLLTAPCGFGKTALLCRWYAQLAQEGACVPYIYFADRHDGSHRPEMPLKCWLADIRTPSAQHRSAATDDDFGLVAHLLGKAFAADGRKRVLLIDDVCLLDDSRLVMDDSWVPPHTVVVCTADIESAPLYGHCDTAQLTPLTPHESAALISRRFAEVGKSVPQAVMQALQDKHEGRVRSAGIALWSVMMVRRMTLLNASWFDMQRRRTGADEETKIEHSLADIVAQAAPYPEHLFTQMAHEAEAFADMAWGKHVLRFLAASECGLRESDLRTLMGDQWDALKWATLQRALGTLLATHDESGTVDFAYPCFRAAVCIEAEDSIQAYADGLARYMLHTAAATPTDSMVQTELPYLAFKSPGSDIFAYLTSDSGRHLRPSLLQAVADLAVRRPKHVVPWVSHYAAASPLFVARLVADVMSMLADGGNDAAALSLGSPIAEIIAQAQGEHDADDTTRLAQARVVSLMAVSLYRTGHKADADAWARWLLNNNMDRFGDDACLDVLARAVYVMVRVWHDNGGGEGSDDMMLWMLHALNFMQRLVLDLDDTAFIKPQQELADLYRQTWQEAGTQGDLPAQVVMADLLQEQPWTFHAHATCRPLLRMAGMTAYGDSYVSACLTAEAQRTARLLAEAAPDQAFFADTDCLTLTCSDTPADEAEAVEAAEQSLYLLHDPGQAQTYLQMFGTLADPTRTDAIGVRANMVSMLLPVAMHRDGMAQDGTTHAEDTDQEAYSMPHMLTAYASLVMDAYRDTTDEATLTAMDDCLLLFAAVGTQCGAASHEFGAQLCRMVFDTEHMLYMRHDGHHTPMQTLRLQVAFYMLCSMTEWLFKERQHDNPAETGRLVRQLVMQPLSLMQAMHLSGTLVVQGYALIYHCLAYVCEQTGDTPAMLHYSKQHEYATCEAWRMAPDDTEAARRYASAIDETGRLFYMICGNTDEAARCFERAGDMFARLFERDGRGDILNDVILNAYNMINIYSTTQRYDALCQKARQTLQLAASRLDDPRLDLGVVAAIAESLGHALVMLGHADEATHWLQEAQGVYEENLARHPDDEKCMRDLAISLCRTVEYMLARGCNADEALAALDKAERLLKQALAVVPDSPKAVKNYIGLLNTRIRMHIYMRHAEALEHDIALFEKFTLQHMLHTRDTSMLKLTLSCYDTFAETAAEAGWGTMYAALLQVKQNAVTQLVEQRLMKP